MNINDIYNGFHQNLMEGFIPDVMVIAHPEGTWLLRKGEEPKLLGEEKDFEPIMLDMLEIRRAA